MSGQFRPTLIDGDNWSFLRIQGVIDEDNRLEALARDIRTGVLVIDLSDVERINSCGVRDWVNWVAALEKAQVQTHLICCSSAIVAQLNLVGNFVGHASIRSVTAPYYCDSCDFEHTEKLNLEDLVKAPKTQAPGRNCPQCQQPMSFDDIEDSFFGFVNAVTVSSSATVDPIVAAALEILGEDQWGETSPITPPVDVEPSSGAKITKRDPVDPPPLNDPAEESKVLSRTDVFFYLSLGALSALLLLLVYRVAL
jgi:anti-anti-sigma regulatory factor